MHIGNATFRRRPCYFASPGASATRPPGDTSGARQLAQGSGRTESPMDASVKPGIVKPFPKGANPPSSDHVHKAPQPVAERPSREQAEAAVRTLIAYIGDNPAREGLLDTAGSLRSRRPNR